jgi:DNA processing protein
LKDLARHPRLLSDEKLDWPARSEGVGLITFFHPRAMAGPPARRAARARLGRKAPIRIGTEKEAARELAAVNRAGAQLLAWLEPAYPVPLAAIEDAPPLVTVRGDASLLSKRNVAVVGARNASANGRAFAERIARDLGQAEYVVASGLARGIDAAAQGPLATGTVAALWHRHCHPPDTPRDDAIAAVCLRHELLPGTEPLARISAPQSRHPGRWKASSSSRRRCARAR